jgi:hypothetical protein
VSAQHVYKGVLQPTKAVGRLPLACVADHRGALSVQRLDEALHAQHCAEQATAEASKEAQVWREKLDEAKYDLDKVQKASAHAQVCGVNFSDQSSGHTLVFGVSACRT